MTTMIFYQQNKIHPRNSNRYPHASVILRRLAFFKRKTFLFQKPQWLNNWGKKKPFTAVDQINSLNDHFTSDDSGNDIQSYYNNVTCKCDIVF